MLAADNTNNRADGIFVTQVAAVKQADRIRQFLLDNYVAPARKDGRSEITVRAGDIHKRMGLQSAMPAVCSAIGGKKFLELASVSLRHRAGPSSGSNAYFTYDLKAKAPLQSKPARSKKSSAVTRSRPKPEVNFKNTLVLISCVKSKRGTAAAARDLYTSHWFKQVRNLVESANAPWFVLSALHGLVEPTTIISPYEHSLKTVGVSERRAWASDVCEKLLPIATKYRRVIIFAGTRYREFLVGPLQEAGLEVRVPMQGLTQGKQLSWLAEVSTARGRSVCHRPAPRQRRLNDLKRFYRLLSKLAAYTSGPRLLEDLSKFRDWPKRGVYYFYEPHESRLDTGDGLRIVRVGTHAVSAGAKSTLRQRLSSHRGNLAGGGNHRRSIFRVLVGQALLERDGISSCPSWGVKNDIRKTSNILGVGVEALKSREAPIERAVSKHLSAMPFLWLAIDDEPSPESLRSYIERNSIALLSNVDSQVIDAPSATWLGQYSNRDAVRTSGLWNQRHTSEGYDPEFLRILGGLISDIEAYK